MSESPKDIYVYFFTSNFTIQAETLKLWLNSFNAEVENPLLSNKTQCFISVVKLEIMFIQGDRDKLNRDINAECC